MPHVSLFCGDAGVTEGKALDLELTRLCARRPAVLVLDLSRLRSISSLVMRQLLAARRSICRTGRMRVAAVPAQVMDSLKHARLDTVFEIFATVEEALAP